MTKSEYMKNLQDRLASFSQELQEDILEDYRQHFAEGENQGKSEEEIIEELGNIEDMVQDLSDEGFGQYAAEAIGSKQADAEEMKTEMKQSFSYSGRYRAAVLDAKLGDIVIERSEDELIHVDYEVKGVYPQLYYEYYQYDEEGIFHAGIKKKANVNADNNGEERLIKVTLFGKTIISYGNVGNYGNGGQHIVIKVRIPEGIPKLTAKVGSGNVRITGLKLEELFGSSGSGNVKVYEMAAEKLCANTRSGNISVSNAEFEAGECKAGSGNIRVEEVRGKSLSCSAGSGNIKVESAVRECQLTVGSGNIQLTSLDAFEKIKAVAGSGNTRLDLRSIEGMTASVKKGSGDAYISWNGEERQKIKSGTYTYGNGSCKVDVAVGSGCVSITGNP